MKKQAFYPELGTYLENIEAEFNDIPEGRIQTLNRVADYVKSSITESGSAELVFICTHNSRRSHLGQVWAATAAVYYGVDNIHTFSGGTGATAFNPRAVAALERAGFSIEKTDSDETNPVYLVQGGRGIPAASHFSKKFDDPSIPDQDFCAIMVCSDADEACPFVPGAADRISLPYEDPKAFDGTDLESRKYDERSREIARDMFYIFQQVSG